MQQSYLPSPAPAMSSGKAGTGAALLSRLVWMFFLSSSVIQQRHLRNDISLNLPCLVCFVWGKKMLGPMKKSPTSTIPGGLRGEGFQGFFRFSGVLPALPKGGVVPGQQRHFQTLQVQEDKAAQCLTCARSCHITGNLHRMLPLTVNKVNLFQDLN